MPGVDWLWEHSIFIVVGIAALWSLVRLVSHFRDQSTHRQAMERLRASCKPEVARLAEYARSSNSGLRAALATVRDEGSPESETTSPAKIILLDLAKIVEYFDDRAEHFSSNRVELIETYCAATFDPELEGVLTYDIQQVAKTALSEDSGQADVVSVLASGNHPDRHKLREMYIDFASLAAEADVQGFAELSKVIRDASRTKSEMLSDVAEAMERLEDSLNMQLNAQCWELLGVTEESTPAEIKAAYHRQVAQWHPDRLHGMAPELQAAATERLREINEAYETISGSIQA